MKKIIALLIVFMASQFAFADTDYAGGLTITSVRFHYDWNDATGIVSVGVDNVPSGINVQSSNSDICFKFDATTEEGKMLLSVVLAAKLSMQKVGIWYTPNKDGVNSTANLSLLKVLEIK